MAIGAIAKAVRRRREAKKADKRWKVWAKAEKQRRESAGLGVSAYVSELSS